MQFEFMDRAQFWKHTVIQIQHGQDKLWQKKGKGQRWAENAVTE